MEEVGAVGQERQMGWGLGHGSGVLGESRRTCGGTGGWPGRAPQVWSKSSWGMGSGSAESNSGDWFIVVMLTNVGGMHSALSTSPVSLFFRQVWLPAVMRYLGR